MISNEVTIFMGDVGPYLGMKAKQHDGSAWLLNCDSLHRFTERSSDVPTTVYTSLGDLPLDLSQILDILKLADVIVYCPPEQWSDNKMLDMIDPFFSIQGKTEILLMLLPSSVQLKSFSPFSPADVDPNPLMDVRKTQDPQLWIAGCSISHGEGLSADQRYGALLANELQLECSFLTRRGSALDWSADQILRSDIRDGDIVIWGLTSVNRITYIHNHKLLRGVNVHTYDTHPEYQDIIAKTNLFSCQTLYQHFYSLQTVINFCEKIGAALYLVNLLDYRSGLFGFLWQQKNYISIPYDLDSDLQIKFRDLGSDLAHPGIEQHQIYKKTILDFINLHK